MNNKFSIIMATYNNSELIDKAINSVINQSYKNWELVIIDDGSTDNTKIKVQKYQKDKRIKYVYQKNKGVSISRNKGMNLSSGDYITFLDSDDWYDKDFLYEINLNICSFSSDIIITNIRYVFDGGSHINKKVSDYEITDINKNLLIDSTIDFDYALKKYGINFGNCRCIGGKFYKKEILEKIKFPIELYTFEDGIFNLEVYKKSNHISIRGYSGYNYYQNNTSSTHTYKKDTYQQYKMIIKYIESIFKNNNEKLLVIKNCEFNMYTYLINLSVYYKDYNMFLEYTNYYKKRIQGVKYLKIKNTLIYILLKLGLYRLIYWIYNLKRLVK